MKFWEKFTESDESLQEFEKKLKKLSFIDLPNSDRIELKRRILFVVRDPEKVEFLPGELRDLACKIQEVGQKTVVGLNEALRLKVKLLALAERFGAPGLSMASYCVFRHFRTLLATVLLVAFGLSSIFLFPLRLPVVSASNSTYFEEVSGKVFVLRNGLLLPARVDFALQEGDIILTKEDGFTSVRFFDDSVSRMAENTQLALKRLSSEPFNPVATRVELALQEGHSWFRVLNLVDEDAFFKVETSRMAASVSKKAAFDLQAHFYESYLAVFDNVVDYSLINGISSSTKSLLAGFKAHVGGDGKVRVSAFDVASPDADETKSAPWVESNLQRDKLYSDRVVAGKTKSLTVDAAGKLPVREKYEIAGEKVLSNHELEKLRVQFMEAYKRLLLGETFLARQQIEEGLKLVLEFKNSLKTIILRLKDFEKIDLLNSGVLRSIIDARIIQQRKDIATLLPGNPLYQLKQILEETELLLAESNVDRVKLHLSYMEDKLLEAQELINSGKFDAAEAIIRIYGRGIRGLVLEVKDENLDEVNSKIAPLFNEQIKQVKALTGIEKSLYVAQNQLLQEVRALRYELLQKIITVSEDVEGAVPDVLLRQLKDLLQTYLAGGAYDKEFVAALNKILQKNKNESLSETAAARLPEKIGLVKLAPEKTPPEAVKPGVDEDYMDDSLTPPSTLPANPE